MKKYGFILTVMMIVFFTLTVPSYSKNVFILCYHAFLEKKDPYSFTEDQFREQLRKLKNSGYTFVSYEDVINDRINGDKNVLISIDDGNKSVYHAYYSIMKPMGIKPLLGIYPAIISRMHYAMTWEQVKDLSKNGCHIASHGYHHMFLNEKYYKQDPAGFRKEIYYSKKILEEKLNVKIDTMIYPFGVNSDIAINELKNAGYKYGLTIIPKMSYVPVNDSFQIPRFLMTKGSQKGVITRIIKYGENQDNGQQYAVNNTGKNSESDRQKHDKISVIEYPERIKNFITNDVIIMPAAKEVKKKKQKVRFKPFVHPVKLAEPAKKNTKVSYKSEKKNSTEKENSIKKDQRSRLQEFKNLYYAILSKWTFFILFIKENTRMKFEIVKIKTARFFS
jgi:peptidoglycan/xylan/chitin deacetylase (PgdA/CDA1 family)